MPETTIVLHPDYIQELSQAGYAQPKHPDAPLIEGGLAEIAPFGMVLIQRNLPKVINLAGGELRDVHMQEGAARAELSRIDARGRRRR